MSSIIYFQLLPNDMLKDNHVRSASSPSARRQFRNRGRRVRPARVYRSWIPVEESVYPNFHVAERKYSVYVTAFARGSVRFGASSLAPLLRRRWRMFLPLACHRGRSHLRKVGVEVENSSRDSDSRQVPQKFCTSKDWESREREIRRVRHYIL